LSARTPIDRRAALSTLLGLAWGTHVLAQTPSAGSSPGVAGSQTGQESAPAPPDWPKELKAGTSTILVHLPQMDSWNGHRLEAHAAVTITTPDSAAPAFGVLEATWDTQVDKGKRTVTLDRLRVVRVRFPSAADKEPAYRTLLDQYLPRRLRTIELDRLEAALATLEAREHAATNPLRNDPPRIVFSTTPAVLILVDGPPVYRQVPSTLYSRVINSRPLVLKDRADTHYLRLFDGWMTAPAVSGPWSVAPQPSADLGLIMQMVAKTGEVDLLAGGDPNDLTSQPSLAKGPVPVVLVATEPTELIVTEGAPSYSPIEGTELLYASNTTGHVFKHQGDQQIYVLITGRWFRAAGLDGPWSHVPGASLPPDFAKIPDSSPKENVKASVPGTPQAQEAVIANRLPETAAIKKSEAKLPPLKYDGPPQLKPIEGTALSYVTNSPYPVIQAGPASYYALYDAVWFVAPSLQGPWAAATTVPAAIYQIPPSSPLHYVTYVNVYRDTPDVVYVGYTPGYYGSYESEGVVVYGTGYDYPAWVDTVYYPAPVTYGYAVSPTYTPWTGWVMGFGFGWAFGAATSGWGWGCYPAWGPYYGSRGAVAGRYGAAAWGPGGWAATTGNVYRRWGDRAAVTRGSAGYNAWTGNSWARSAGMSYNSRTGTLAAGQRATVGNVYSREGVTTGRVAAANPRTGQSGSAAYARGASGGVARVGDDVYATRDGNVYRRTDSGWQQRSAGSWSASSYQGSTGSLNGDAQARSAGQTRVNQYQGTSGARSGGYVSGGGARSSGARGGGGRRR
jgi:hypothetical protein